MTQWTNELSIAHAKYKGPDAAVEFLRSRGFKITTYRAIVVPNSHEVTEDEAWACSYLTWRFNFSGVIVR